MVWPIYQPWKIMLELISRSRCFGGNVDFYQHQSLVCHAPMKFAVYQPPTIQAKLPVLYFLSGLTCTPENFITKAGAQQFAAQHGLLLVVPDTSPRHNGIPHEDLDYDLGSGAGFYVDATEEPWRQHYNMYSYVTGELPELIATNFPVSDRQGICGHSMGGHGALVCGLKNPGMYRSISAFAPIAHPMASPWGRKAFQSYLGSDQALWQSYDATELVRQQQVSFPILIDQGSADQFLLDQLMPDRFAQACQLSNQALNLRLQEGYDHSYYFISTFIADHLRYHAELLA
jgi:S-formylglutathione hydrolase